MVAAVPPCAGECRLVRGFCVGSRPRTRTCGDSVGNARRSGIDSSGTSAACSAYGSRCTGLSKMARLAPSDWATSGRRRSPSSLSRERRSAPLSLPAASPWDHAPRTERPVLDAGSVNLKSRAGMQLRGARSAVVMDAGRRHYSRHVCHERFVVVSVDNGAVAGPLRQVGAYAFSLIERRSTTTRSTGPGSTPR
jgi:hypothetical protein